MRLLLVEDEVEMAGALRAALSRHDLIVDHVATLEEAEEAVRSRSHDAILLDWQLPEGVSRQAASASGGDRNHASPQWVGSGHDHPTARRV